MRLPKNVSSLVALVLMGGNALTTLGEHMLFVNEPPQRASRASRLLNRTKPGPKKAEKRLRKFRRRRFSRRKQ